MSAAVSTHPLDMLSDFSVLGNPRLSQSNAMFAVERALIPYDEPMPGEKKKKKGRDTWGEPEPEGRAILKFSSRQDVQDFLLHMEDVMDVGGVNVTLLGERTVTRPYTEAEDPSRKFAASAIFLNTGAFLHNGGKGVVGMASRWSFGSYAYQPAQTNPDPGKGWQGMLNYQTRLSYNLAQSVLTGDFKRASSLVGSIWENQVDRRIFDGVIRKLPVANRLPPFFKTKAILGSVGAIVEMMQPEPTMEILEPVHRGTEHIARPHVLVAGPKIGGGLKGEYTHPDLFPVLVEWDGVSNELTFYPRAWARTFSEKGDMQLMAEHLRTIAMQKVEFDRLQYTGQTPQQVMDAYNMQANRLQLDSPIAVLRNTLQSMDFAEAQIYMDNLIAESEAKRAERPVPEWRQRLQDTARGIKDRSPSEAAQWLSQERERQRARAEPRNLGEWIDRIAQDIGDAFSNISRH